MKIVLEKRRKKNSANLSLFCAPKPKNDSKTKKLDAKLTSLKPLSDELIRYLILSNLSRDHV